VAGAPAWPEALMTAWFWIRPFAVALIVARKATVVESLMAMLPPVVPFAPWPRRTRTVREADRYSPWSSPVASVLVPAFGPDTIRIDPGR